MFMQDFTQTPAEITVAAPRILTLIPPPVVSGIVAGTLVEGVNGWCSVETLKVGDVVHTLDGGLARILRISRRMLHPSAETALIWVPGGCHDACSDLLLVPGQHVIVDTLGEADFGAAFAMLPATALMADPVVRRHFTMMQHEIVTLLFADEEVVYANSGVMLHCPGIMDGADRYPDNSFFPRLDITDARDFLQRRAERLAA